MAVRGPSAKGLDCVSGARVRIPLSPYYLFLLEYGGVAQLARAFGSYPKGRGFDSLRRYHISRALSSAGRASALQAEGRGFDPLSAHHFTLQWSVSVTRDNAEPWCRGLTCLPVTQETASSNLVGSAIFYFCPCGSVAQSVEQRTENPRVGGSIPSRATIFLFLRGLLPMEG
ncbi:MAG: hypothetical protein K0Q90_2099 [Paenibacillaceae bacterium]|nr:hypothetical protein [Paenibacillaceae bacterium]